MHTNTINNLLILVNKKVYYLRKNP